MSEQPTNDNVPDCMMTALDIIYRERLTDTQASVVRGGLKWARKFGLLRDVEWFDLGDVHTALVLSVIVEEARSAK